MNIQILGAMLRQGCSSQNFAYVIKILDIVKTELIKPNEPFLRHLDRFCKDCGVSKRSGPYGRSAQFKKDFNHFRQELENWKEFMGLSNIKLDEAVEIVRDHPWEQFRNDQPVGMETLKNPKMRHQKKLTRHVQRIKVDKLRDDVGDGKLSISGDQINEKNIV